MSVRVATLKIFCPPLCYVCAQTGEKKANMFCHDSKSSSVQWRIRRADSRLQGKTGVKYRIVPNV